jgi:hypothetical protein
MSYIEALSDLKGEKEGSGLNLTDASIEDALAASSLKHASGTDFNNVLTSGAAVKAFIVDNFHSTNFDKVRP